MRTTSLKWLNRFDSPEIGRPLVLDFWGGLILGAFDGQQFFSLTTPGSWDRLLINRWCYRENYVPVAEAA